MSEINVCLASDNNYSQHVSVVIASILINAKNDNFINFYILDGGINEENKEKILSLKSIKDCKIEFINIDNSMFENYLKIKTHKYISLPTYYRLKLPTLLPNTKRVIYLDCDVVVNADLAEFYNVDMKTSAIAGINDIDKRKIRVNPNYVNAGVLVIDIENMKKQNLEEKFLNWTIEHQNTIKCGDQEIINEVCKGNIKLLQEEWNVQSSNFINRSSYTHEPKIVHFVADKKPWHWASFSYHRNLYFKYLQYTPWKLNKEDFQKWTKLNQIASLFAYFKHRPLFFLRVGFYKAFFKTYLNKK